MSDLPIKIRGLSEPSKPMLDSGGVIINQEKAFIASSWAHKERNNPAYFWVSKRAYHYQFYLGVICFLIDARPDLFRVAVNEDNPDQILGWACLDATTMPMTLYQYYIKEDFRDYPVSYYLFDYTVSCKPEEFERLINDTRKNQVANGDVSQSDVDPRQGVSAVTGNASRQAQSPG